MKKRSVVLASVCAAFMVATAAGPAYAAADAKTPAALMQQAYKQLAAGRPAQAISGYSAAIAHKSISVSDKARAHLNRALAHQKTGKHDLAAADYDSALKLNALTAGTRAAALYNRGLAHARMKQHFAAVDDFTNALYLNPRLADAFFSRANVLRETGQHEYALVDYARANAAGYKHKHLAWFGKALTFLELGHRDEAIAALLKAYAIKPEFKQARARLAGLGVDVPADPTADQIKLAVVPAQNLMADNIITGSGSTATVKVTKAAGKEPVAPSTALLNRLPSRTSGLTLAQAPKQKTLPKRPQDIAVSDVGQVPQKSQANSKPVVVAKAEAKPAARTKVVVQPVSAPAPKQIITGSLGAAPNPVADAPAADEPRVTATLEGWTVQLVSQRDADSAWTNWSKLQKKHGRLLKSQEAAVVKADLGDQGIYYRLRVHKLDNRKQAKRLCNRLKRRGTRCFVARAKT